MAVCHTLDSQLVIFAHLYNYLLYITKLFWILNRKDKIPTFWPYQSRLHRFFLTWRGDGTRIDFAYPARIILDVYNLFIFYTYLIIIPKTSLSLSLSLSHISADITPLEMAAPPCPDLVHSSCSYFKERIRDPWSGHVLFHCDLQLWFPPSNAIIEFN